MIVPKFKDPDDAKLREDTAETASRTLQEAIGARPKTVVPPSERTDAEKDAQAVERGRKGGEKGGKARAEGMTEDQKAEVARLAATARWRKTD